MIFLHVKGETPDLLAELARHGIERDITEQIGTDGVRSSIRVADTPVNRDRVARWYGQHAEIVPGYGFPNGTLLYFAIDE